jgi:hypothetical protein
MAGDRQGAQPCAQCGCLKSNHTYWSPTRGVYSHPCFMHNCPVYVPPGGEELAMIKVGDHRMLQGKPITIISARNQDEIQYVEGHVQIQCFRLSDMIPKAEGTS